VVPPTVGGHWVTHSYKLILEADRATGELQVLSTKPERRGRPARAEPLRLTLPPLKGTRGRLMRQAERMAWHGEKFFETFTVLKRFPESARAGDRAFAVPKKIRDNKVVPVVLDDADAARRVVEKELAGQRRRIHPAQKGLVFEPKQVARRETDALCHRFEIEGRIGKRKARRYVLVPRPALIEKATAMPRCWTDRPGSFLTHRDVQRLDWKRRPETPPVHVGNGVRSDPERFGEGMDLLAHLAFQNDRGFILDRTVDFQNRTWSATAAIWSAARRDLHARDEWRFVRVELRVDPGSGALSIAKLPLRVDEKAGSAPVAGRPDGITEAERKRFAGKLAALSRAMVRADAGAFLRLFPAGGCMRGTPDSVAAEIKKAPAHLRPGPSSPWRTFLARFGSRLRERYRPPVRKEPPSTRFTDPALRAALTADFKRFFEGLPAGDLLVLEAVQGVSRRSGAPMSLPWHVTARFTPEARAALVDRGFVTTGMKLDFRELAGDWRLTRYSFLSDRPAKRKRRSAKTGRRSVAPKRPVSPTRDEDEDEPADEDF
jgi:hypothetical protein